jgi:hypothetical protein
MPCKGEARNVRSQVLWVVDDSQTDTCDKGHITEEPCAAKVARTGAPRGAVLQWYKPIFS